MVIDQIQDIALQYVPIFKESDPEKQVCCFLPSSCVDVILIFLSKMKKDVLNREFFKNELPVLLGYLDSLLKSNKENEPFFLGKIVSLSDLIVKIK